MNDNTIIVISFSVVTVTAVMNAIDMKEQGHIYIMAAYIVAAVMGVLTVISYLKSPYYPKKKIKWPNLFFGVFLLTAVIAEWVCR